LVSPAAILFSPLSTLDACYLFWWGFTLGEQL